jgi:adenosylcobyric acid synthase
MKYRPIFIMGTSSGAGKTTIVTALCRILTRRGLNVSPFKAQNMSLNAGVGIGGEMAYAQVLQAKACGKVPDVRMNPVLLKPEKNRTQVIVNGKYYGTFDAKNYMNSDKDILFKIILNDFEYLSKKSDLIIIEGAGSPAEINIKNDIANVRLAREISSKNILVSDIDRGGAFASIVGTAELIDKNFFSGYIFNKFRGDIELLNDGLKFLKEKYNLKHYGTVPYYENCLPQEDSLWSWNGKGGKIKISIIKLPHIANSTDFQIFFKIREVGVNFASYPEELDGADVIIIPGSKLTVYDLIYLKREGFEEKIKELYKDGTKIVGICGGYQMLGKYIIDYYETKRGRIEGLGILDSKTIFDKRKIVSLLKGKILHQEFYGQGISGYEIHLGRTISKKPFALIYNENGRDVERFDGSYEKNAFGTYFHDLFYNTNFLTKFLNSIAKEKGIDKINFYYSLENEINKLADFFERYLDIDSILND